MNQDQQRAPGRHSARRGTSKAAQPMPLRAALSPPARTRTRNVLARYCNRAETSQRSFRGRAGPRPARLGDNRTRRRAAPGDDPAHTPKRPRSSSRRTRGYPRSDYPRRGVMTSSELVKVIKGLSQVREALEALTIRVERLESGGPMTAESALPERGSPLAQRP